MAEYREVRHMRLYLKEPRTERLRKSAEGRLRYLLSTGWREVERSGHAPRMTRLPKPPPQLPRPPRQGPGQGRGGFGGRGGPGGPGAGPR